ncbi:MAG: IS3 family transposase [Nitrospirae bacterium]|nr:IS3 family transposase [Nitrospirota bacterium]MDE3042693.1 transposase [Nitrospirota bacterium]MDE3220349.1 transposase [Nitrospirota bacterium]
MVNRTHALPVVRQCQLLELSRSTAYDQPTPVSAAELALMRRIDELHLASPFAGARMLRDLLRREGHSSGRRHVSTLMTRMGITAVYRKPRTSQRHPAHPVYPYLLRPTTQRGDHPVEPCLGSGYQCAMQARLEKDQLRRLLPTGSWNAAPLGKDTERKGAAQLRDVPRAGCHTQSSLNCTGRGPLPTSRATTGSRVRQRSVCRKPLYLEQPTLNDGMAWRDCGAIRLVLMLPTEGCATRLRRWEVLCAIVQSHQG